MTSSNTHVAARSESKAPQAFLTPTVDILETEAGITLLADMPGVSKERTTIKIDGQSMTIEGIAEVDVPVQLELVHAEVRSPNYRRVFTLSPELDLSKIEASVRHGVLNLHIPKAEAARPRQIRVDVK